MLRSALEGKAVDDFDDLQQEGLVQRFEYTFELLWKTLRDFLQSENVDIDIISPKNVIKAAARTNLLERIGADGEALLDILDTRNLLSRTYDSVRFREALLKLKDAYLSQIGMVYDYLLAKRLGDG